MYKVFLGVGHGGADPGAVANGLKEKGLTLSVAKACFEFLSKYGVSALMSRTKDENDSVSEEIKECNAFSPDLAVDIHINSNGKGTGDGAEAYHYHKGGKGKILAENILEELERVGQNSRGAKTRLNSSGSEYYAFIRDTSAPATIVECAFIDNKNDISIMDTEEEQKTIGEAIAKGILNTLGISFEEEEEQEEEITNPLMMLNKLSEQIKINDLLGAVNALTEAKKTDSPLYWILYKLVNEKKESEKPPDNITDVPEDAKDSIIGITRVIEIDPRNIWHVETQKATNETPYDNFVNSIFFMPQANGIMFPQGMAVNAGEVLSNYPTHQKPVATLIVYGKDDVRLKYISDITKEKGVWFAVSGYGIYPEITNVKEGFTGKFSDVLRETNRPIIGYRKKDNKIVIAVRANSSAQRAKETAKNLELDFAISLDAGGSTTLKINDKYIFKGDGRKLWGGITWK